MIKHLGTVVVSALFVIYLAVGIAIHADFGISWDEPISRTNGLVNLRYVEEKFAPDLLTDELKRQPDLYSWPDKDYGVAFELPLVALEQIFGIDQERPYEFRHLIVFLFSALGVLAVYKTACFVYRDYRIGLLAASMLVLSPRIFGESFYNSKDIVFMAAISMATYTMICLISRPRVMLAIAHGAICAFAIDVRIMGVVMVAATVGMLAVRVLKKEISFARVCCCAGAYLVTTVVVVIALFPFLWEDPVGHFAAAFGNMATFRWNNWVLYLGQLHRATDLPWHYIPVFMLLTTPVLFSVLMMAGVVNALRGLVQNRLSLWRSETQMAEQAFLALLIGPILAIIAIHAVVYDGWRHLYFVYPAFVLVAVGGYLALSNGRLGGGRSRMVLVAFVALSLGSNLYLIVRSHPMQNVYFNLFAGKGWKDHFDVDYWGLANRAALEFIRDHDDRGAITIKVASMTLLDTGLLWMRPEERQRFLVSSRASKPEYVLTNYRLDVFNKKDFDPSDYSLYYRKKVFGEPILSVYRIRDSSRTETLSSVARAYSADEFRHLSYHAVRRYRRDGHMYVDLRIENGGSELIAGASSIGKPIRASWRFLDEKGEPSGGWDARVNLSGDIPAHGATTVVLPIDTEKEIAGGMLQISLVQEGVFWAFDIGIPPVVIPWTLPDA